jgi:lipoteichoic acid synthase
MIIPTEKKSWSQEAMCKKYGIETLFSKEGYPSEVKADWLNDKQLFEFAMEKNKNLIPPFMSFILTSSMHSPYIKSYENYDINYPKDFSPELKHYLDNVHYMDIYLGKYIETLKEYPWYDECTIIITADHKPNGPKLQVADETLFSSLPLIIIHKNVSSTFPIEQTSIFPTILDLYHIKHKWRGVGQSILMPDSIRNNEYEMARLKNERMISDYIINKDYINK